MTTGPYSPGDKSLSTGRLNDTDRLSRRRIYFGEGFSVAETGTEIRVNLKPEKKVQAVAVSGGSRYAYVVQVLERRPEELLVQFLEQRKETFGEDPDAVTRVVWEKAGDPRVAIVPPNFRGSDFVLLIPRNEAGKPVTFGVTHPTIRLAKIAEDWVVEYAPRWAITDIPDGSAIVRCQ